MKKILLSLIISLGLVGEVMAQDLSIVSNAVVQTIILKDGLYCLSNGGLYSGSYTAYFESGKKKSMFDVKEGKANGAVVYYYENGNIMEMGSFVSNEKKR